MEREGQASSLADKTLTIYFPTLHGGGAERLYLNLAPFFLNAGLKVAFLLDRAEGELLNAIPEGASIEILHAPRLRHAISRLTAYIKRTKPDLFFSSLSLNNIAVIWAKALAGGETKIIVSQHNTLTREVSNGRMYRALPLLNRLFLSRADAVAAVSHGVAEDLAQITRLPAERIDIIPNGVITPQFDGFASAACPHQWLRAKAGPVFLSVGRLTPQKDFPTLLRAFATLRKSRDARLIVLGEGPLRETLLALALSLGIADDVDFAGYVSNPLPFMRLADALVLASTHEGFGLVLAEALACGTPVISTDCQFGPAEILDNGRYGTLVPVGDAEALAGAMLRVLDVEPPRDILRARGQEFSVSRCAAQYISLFERVLGTPC